MTAHLTDSGAEIEGKIAPRRQTQVIWAPLILLVLAVLVTLVIYAPSAGSRVKAIVSNVLLPLITLPAAGALAYAARKSASISRRLAAIWGLAAGAMLCMVLIGLVWGLVEILRGEQPTPSPAGVFFLLCYPVVIAGLIHLPQQENIALNDRLQDELAMHRRTFQALSANEAQLRRLVDDLNYQRDLFEKLIAVARATTSSPSLEPTLKNALEVSMNTTGAERSSLFLVDGGSVVMHSLMEQGGSLRVGEQDSGKLVMDQGLAGWVYRNQEAVLVQDVEKDERWLYLPDREYIIRSALLVPIILDTVTLGVLGLFHCQPDWFKDEHLAFLKAAADQIALALRNTRLYEEERRLTEELTRAKEVSEAAYRAKSMFLAKVSHELRTPLTVILGYSEMLSEYARQVKQEAFLDPLDKIQASSHLLITLINDILDFSEIEAGRLELVLQSFAVTELVQEAVEKARPLAERHRNTLSLEFENEAGMMHSDTRRLSQILDNLLDNACKFTNQGSITVRVTRKSDAAGDWISFSVSDSGIGISADQVHKLFQAFTQVELQLARTYEGTGLGLAISRQLARMLGGDIKVVSQPGKGSTFTVHLPCRMDVG